MKAISRRYTPMAALAVMVLLLQGCGGSGSSKGGYGYGDGPPPKDVEVAHIPDAVPKVEPVTKAGNKSPYTVFGKTYEVLPSSIGYRQQGVASWSTWPASAAEVEGGRHDELARCGV